MDHQGGHESSCGAGPMLVQGWSDAGRAAVMLAQGWSDAGRAGLMLTQLRAAFPVGAFPHGHMYVMYFGAVSPAQEGRSASGIPAPALPFWKLVLALAAPMVQDGLLSGGDYSHPGQTLSELEEKAV